uniref:retroelement silencing factor 1 n=1 Tax=Euleptes europaea TaxID=460621 RepID=UPI002540E05E|nr:retroelement silencing factor 1 [Euleptes europaea]
MDWTVSPLHTANLQARNFQVQGMYHSQQPASGFSQASTSTENFSIYTGNDQVIRTHSSTENMVANELPSPNNVGSNNFQPPFLKASVPNTGFGTTQNFVALHPPIQLSNLTVQMTPGMAKNTWPNSNVYTFSPVAPQFSTGNTVQRPPNPYMASSMYNNRPQKICSKSVQAFVFRGNINSSRSKRFPMLVPKYRHTDSQTHATVSPNQVSSHFLNSQPNSSCLTFPSGQNIQNQINDMNSASTTAVQSQQYASNCVYSPYTIPTHYAAQVIPQATNTNLPPPPYAVPPIQINHGEFVLPQPVQNTSKESVQNPQNLELNQSSGSYSVQGFQTLESVPISRETNEVGGAADSRHGHSAENQPSDELTESAVEALKSICNNLQIPGTIPLDKTSAPQTTSITIQDNISKSSGNVLYSLIKSKPITKESLELDWQKILAITKKRDILQATYKLKQQLFESAEQKSKTSDPTMHNPDLSPPSSNTNQQPAALLQATQQTFSLPSHDATQKLASLLPHDNTQNQPPSLLARRSSQIQDSSSLPLRTKSHLHPILRDLLKGTSDEEMLLNMHVAGTEGNQNKQLVIHEKNSSDSVLDSKCAKSETSVNDMERASRLSPKMSQTVSTQGPLTSTDVRPRFEQTSALSKDQLIKMSFMSNKDKIRMLINKILTNRQSVVSVQNPTASSASSQLRERIAKKGSENFQNFRSEFIQQNKDNCLRAPDNSITSWNSGNDSSNSSSLAVTVPEAGIVQRSSVTGNSCTVERTCSFEELETSLALWRKSCSASLNEHLGEKSKSTTNSFPLDIVEDKERACAMKSFPNALTDCEKSSVAVGKNEPSLSSVPSSLGQKLDTMSSSSLKSSEPQIAIVSPLILSKEGLQNEVQEKKVSSILETVYPVIEEGSVHSLYKCVLTVSDADKPIKITACSPSDCCGTVKDVHSGMPQKMAKSTGKNGIQRAEIGTDCSCDPNQGLTGPLELGKNIPPLYSRDCFLPGTDNDSTSPVSQKCAPKTSPDMVEPEDSVLNKNILQISSVCTLVQGDAFYNSQIASIFNTSSLKSKAENNTSSEDQRPDSYNKEQQLSHWKRDSEINGSTSVGDVLLPSLGPQSKAAAEKLLNLPCSKVPQSGKVSDEVNERDSEEENNTDLCNPNSGKDTEQNISCNDVHSADSATGNQKVPGNSIVDEGSTQSIQEYVPSDENQAHSVNNIDIALTLPNDQLTELLKEFPYGIDDSKVLKKTGNEDSATKLIYIKDGQETETCGQNSDANHALDQIKITILNPQQMKELFPEYSSQSSNKLENRENDKILITSEDTNKSHIQTILSENTNTSAETVQKPASQSYCCLKGWIGLEYVVDPCQCMLDKEAALKQQLGQYLPSEITIKEEPETNDTSSTDCLLNSQQQTIYPFSNNLPSEDENNKICSKTFVHRENDFQEKECKPLKEEKELIPVPSLEKLESLKLNKKKQRTEELPEKVQIELCNQKCATLVSKSQELLYSGSGYSKGESIRSACKRELSNKERIRRESVVDKAMSDTLRHRSMVNKPSKKNEKYKIKRDSSETHIIKGPTHTLKRGLKKHTASKEKLKTSERPCSTVTNSSNLSSVDLVSRTYNNTQHSQEHLNRQKCKIKRHSENNKAMRTEHNESSSSGPIRRNKESLVRRNLKKFAYPEERGNVWQYRRSLSDNTKTSKLQTFRGQHLNMYKTNYLGKEAVWGAHKRDGGKILSDKKSLCNRKSNILTLQREQKKNYLNKVAFKQTERSICLTNLEQSPSKSVWHVKSSTAEEHPGDEKNYTPCSQQSEVTKTPMLEFKMCPEIVFRNLVSEEVPEVKKLPEKEATPVAAVKSKREDWLNCLPPKKRKIDEVATQVEDHIPQKSNATFETYKKMHLEKRSRSLDSSPLN